MIIQSLVSGLASTSVGPPVITAEITDSTGTPSSLTGDGSSGTPWDASTTRVGSACFIEVTLTSDQSETFTDIHVSGLKTDYMVTAIVDSYNMTCTITTTGIDIAQEQRKVTFTSVSTGQTTDIWIDLTAVTTL